MKTACVCPTVYDMIEQLMLRRNIKINFPIRFSYRTVYVIFTTFIAITLVGTQSLLC
jgi:hypothetical protein